MFNSYRMFRKTISVLWVKVAFSTSGNQVRILQSEVFYWLPVLYLSKIFNINKYKVCINKSRTAYFGMWSSSLPYMAARYGKPCSISIFSSVSSFISSNTIPWMLAIFVWNLPAKTYVTKYKIKQAIQGNMNKENFLFVDNTVNG